MNSNKDPGSQRVARQTGLPGSERLLLLKMWRDLTGQRGQFVAVLVVLMLGTMVFGATYVPFQNLKGATSSYYDRYRFADLSVTVHPMPASAVSSLRALRGVASVYGRVAVDVPLDMPNAEDRITARLIGLPVPRTPIINDISLDGGRYFDGNLVPQALVQPETQFFNEHGLMLGDVIKPVINGRRRDLTIVGLATTPEYVVPIRSALDLLSPASTFLVVFVPHDFLAAELGYGTNINEVLVRYQPGVTESEKEQLQKDIEDRLDRYGVVASVPRKDQISNQILNSEMTELEGMAYFIPIFFYAAAAMVLYNLLLRLIEGQRVQIGVLRSLGYPRQSIFAHYLSFAVLISIIGSTAGAVVGWAMAGQLTAMYAGFFNIPVLSMQMHWGVVAVAYAVSLVFSVAAALIAVRRTIEEVPAELLRRGGLENLNIPGWYAAVARWMRSASLSVRLAMRNLLRNPRRAGMTILGIVFSVTLLVGTFFFIDAMDYMLMTNFGERQNYELKTAFSGAVSTGELHTLESVPGVLVAEPLLEQPFKLRNGRFEETTVVNGVARDSTMVQLYDETGAPVRMPDSGLLLDDALMRKLHVAPGDSVTLETVVGPKKTYTTRVSGKMSQLTGSNAYMNIVALQRLTRSGPVMTGAYLHTEKGAEPAIKTELLDMSHVEYALSPSNMEEVFQQYLTLFYGMIVVFIGMAGALAFAIVFNTTQMNIMERRQEIASMRVLGLDVSRIGQMILYENVVMAVAGYAVGVPLGRQMAKALVDSAASELYHLPLIIYPRTYILVAVLIVGFVTLAYLPGVRIIRNMSLVEVIKVHES